MDCGTISHLPAGWGCLLGNTTLDETLGFVGLVVIGVGGLAVMIYTLIKNWNPPPAEQAGPPDTVSGSE